MSNAQNQKGHKVCAKFFGIQLTDLTKGGARSSLVDKAIYMVFYPG